MNTATLAPSAGMAGIASRTSSLAGKPLAARPLRALPQVRGELWAPPCLPGLPPCAEEPQQRPQRLEVGGMTGSGPIPPLDRHRCRRRPARRAPAACRLNI
jgi:hypothetical protein